MRRIGVATDVALGLVCIFAAVSGASPTQAAGWKMVFREDFDGSELNRDRWATRYIYNNETLDRLNDEKEHYADNKNHVLDDGWLSLVARKGADGRVESGMIRSRQTFYYGYFETRVRLPSGTGVWPAFWLNPDYDERGRLSWPPEIDVFEYAVNGKDDRSDMIHSAASRPKGIEPIYDFVNSKYKTKTNTIYAGEDLSASPHVFGLLWRPHTISVFMDGELMYTRQYEWKDKTGGLAAPAHILLNLAIGGAWAGRYGITATYPISFSVDYVLVCQMSGERGAGQLCGGSRYTPDPIKYGYTVGAGDMERVKIFNAKLKAQEKILTSSQVSTRDIDIVGALNVPATYSDGLKLKTVIVNDARSVVAVQITPLGEAAGENRTVSRRVALPADMKAGAYTVVESVGFWSQPADSGPGSAPVLCEGKTVRARSCDTLSFTVK